MEKRESLVYYFEYDPYSKNRSTDYLVQLFHVEIGHAKPIGIEVVYKKCKYTAYLLPLELDSGFLFFYLGTNYFDKDCEKINNDFYEGYMNAYPLFMEAYLNGCNKNYTKSAITKIQIGETTNKTFWCIGTMVDNIDYNNLVTDYGQRKFEKLYTDLSKILVERATNKINNWDKLKRLIRLWNDTKDQVDMIKPIIDIILKVINPI